LSYARHGATGYFQRVLAKYGRDAFDWEVVAELPTSQEAKVAERILIALSKPEYNLTAGGDGTWGCSKSPETRAKMSASMRGAKTPEGLERIRAANRARAGIHLSKEHKAKLSVSIKAAGNRPPQASTEELRARQLGKKASAETRAKMSAASKGKPKSVAARANMKIAASKRQALRRASLVCKENL